jgi:transcriptional regulator with PAS, ATPase and Fis domain
MYLSPGTPAMAAIWVLLGKTRYPATFYQSHEGRSWKTEIPFDVTLDVVPQLLRDPDAHLQHLAAESPKEVRGFEGIIGDSKSIRLAAGRAKRASVRDVSVFILGESGTGKEMFARAIHEASPRRGKTFIAINCAAIPEQLLESELLGHVKGSFTGAIHDRQGAFEKADGGTLFLDEIGECSSTIQVKLLRVLQPPPGQGPCCRRFMRLGETQERQSNVRVIAATNCNLHEAISQNRFREDLYYRLAVITLTLPPLRERKADIPLIAEALLAQVNRDFAGREPGYQDKTISVSANAFLKRQDWPGNVRQLYNVLLQAAVMSEGDVIEPSDLAASMAALPGRRSSDLMGLPLGDGFSLEDLQEKVQRHYLQRAMVEAGGRKTAAAKLLGMRNYQTLDAQLKRLGVKVTGE